LGHLGEVVLVQTFPFTLLSTVVARWSEERASGWLSAETAGRGAVHERLLVTPWRALLNQRTTSCDRLGSSYRLWQALGGGQSLPRLDGLFPPAIDRDCKAADLLIGGPAFPEFDRTAVRSVLRS
jgi:hypothetical protein